MLSGDADLTAERMDGAKLPLRLARLRPAGVFALSAVLTAALSVAHHALGPAVSFDLFYLGPVVLAAWLAGRSAGLAVGALAACSWLLVERVPASAQAYPLVYYGNALTRFGAFGLVTAIVVALRAAVDHERLATRTDALTGLHNGRGFRELTHTEVRRLRRTGRPLTLAFIDLDHFKAVNDTRGHATGDLLLQTVARVIVQTLRSTDVAARVGGDEFAILLTETPAEPASIVLRKVHNALRLALEEAGWPVTTSIGAISCVQAPPSSDELIRLADELMYEVKRSGRNRVHHGVYDPVAAAAS